MVSTYRARCHNGHDVEFGACNARVEILGGLLTKVCTSTEHIKVSPSEVQCRKCNTSHFMRFCPKCKETIPVSYFTKKG